MKDKKNPTCFISYCHDGADMDSVNYLIRNLRDVSRQQIEFLYDDDLEAGDKINSFMTLIRSTDGVIILLTPEYKKRIQERRGGVYKEFSEIMLRYHELEEKANICTTTPTMHERIKPPFCLIPLIFSGDFNSSCPEEISENKCLNFVKYRAHRKDNGKLHITTQTSSQFSKQITKLVDQIFTYHVSQTSEALSSFESMIVSFFEKTKEEHLRGDPKFENSFKHIFVKTYAFKKVFHQTSYLLIGRKGSGKSTIVHYLSLELEDKYKAIIEINVNHFDMEYLYSLISTRQTRAELGIIVNQVYIFEAVWELFLYICCMFVLVEEQRRERLQNVQIKYLPAIKDFLSEMTASSDIANVRIDYRATYRWCYAKIIDYLDKAIQSTRNELPGFNYDLAHLLTLDNILRAVLKTNCFEAFEAILSHCKRRFLTSLDGFDTAFEEFRIRTQYNNDADEKHRRTQYEIDWLRGFMHVVIEMKSSPNKTSLAHLIDFCVTIPKDRFIEIRDYERDSYIYIGKYHEIRWSAIELAILVYKRLEIIENFFTDKQKRPQQRLDEILINKFPYIPIETISNAGENTYKIHIFIEVLRHTFWRPREILIYFAKIISVLRDMRKRNIEITQFAIGKCISDTTREVIKTEFINEFQRHCTNLRDILDRFRKQKQILTKSEVEEILGGIGFNFIGLTDPIPEFKTQVKFLYEIGFIGLEADNRTKDRLKLLHPDIFWFNAGDEPFEVLLNEGFTYCQFIIHPIFCDYLDININKQRLILNFDWDYLQKQEAHIIAPA